MHTGCDGRDQIVIPVFSAWPIELNTLGRSFAPVPIPKKIDDRSDSARDYCPTGPNAVLMRFRSSSYQSA